MSEPLFPLPEPGEHPSQRGTTDDQHPWALSSLNRWSPKPTDKLANVRVTADEVGYAAQAISHFEPHPGYEHVEWPDGFDAWTIAHTVLSSLGVQVDAPMEPPK